MLSSARLTPENARSNKNGNIKPDFVIVLPFTIDKQLNIKAAPYTRKGCLCVWLTSVSAQPLSDMRDFSFKYLIVVLAFGLISAFAFYFDSRGIFFRLPVFVVFAIIGFVIIAIGYLTILIHLLLDRRFTKALSVLLGVITLCVVA